MWDNRNDKRNPKSPDYKCKNRSCGEGVWEDRQSSTGAGVGSGSMARPASPQQAPHAVLYKHCVMYAIKEIKPLLSADVCDADVLAAAATLFIQASRGGQVFAPKNPPQAAPPPPPPPEPAWEDPNFLPF